MPSLNYDASLQLIKGDRLLFFASKYWVGGGSSTGEAGMEASIGQDARDRVTVITLNLDPSFFYGAFLSPVALSRADLYR